MELEMEMNMSGGQRRAEASEDGACEVTIWPIWRRTLVYRVQHSIPPFSSLSP